MTVAFAGTWTDVVEHRPAFFGGLAGSIATCGLLVLAAMHVRPDPSPASDAEAEIAFQPGFIARLGIDEAIGTDPGTGIAAPDTPPEPVDPATPSDPTTSVDPSDANAISDAPTHATPPRRKPSTRPAGALPQPSTTPGKLPAIGKGNPFASADGWSDIDQAGEPWATAVMAELASLEVQAFRADLTGRWKFQLTICSDGSIDRIVDRGGTLSPAGRDAVRLALERLDLPRPPESVRRMMGGRRCRQIAHVFVWSVASIK